MRIEQKIQELGISISPKDMEELKSWERQKVVSVYSHAIMNVVVNVISRLVDIKDFTKYSTSSIKEANYYFDNSYVNNENSLTKTFLTTNEIEDEINNNSC